MVALGFREDADGQLVLPMVRKTGRQTEAETETKQRQREGNTASKDMVVVGR